MPSSKPPLSQLAIMLALAGLLAACGTRTASPGASDRQAPSAALSVETRQCLTDLAGEGHVFTPLPDRDYGLGCSAVGTVAVTAIQGDKNTIALTNLDTIACPLAAALSAWTRFGVDRAARQMLGSSLVQVETMGSYSCRNVSGTVRRSAHAQAKAVDVSAFVLQDGRRITVAGDWTSGPPAHRAFLRTIHASACKRFGMVLGPDYNAAHRDHFHLQTDGGGYCR